jgi:FdhD protein
MIIGWCRARPSYRLPGEAAIEISKVEVFEVQPEAQLLQPVANAPRLSASICEPVREIEIVDESGARRTIVIPCERALTVVLDEHELLTLMTLGAAAELLVLGFLCNQRLIENAAALESIAVDWQHGLGIVKSRALAQEPHRTMPRGIAGASGQGSRFARLMEQVDTIRLPAKSARIERSALQRALEIMRQHDNIHRHARSVHSCALFEGERLLVSVEDVGRHNALDTISGWMALYGVDGGDKILFTTGRLTGEMVIKAAQCGVPIMVSRNGVSTMGYDLARKFGMTLIGRAANKRFQCYVGSERLV